MDSSLILHKGHITHVIDPSSFWMRMGTDAHFQEFEEYQRTLNKFYNETGRKDSADNLSQGDCVMVADPHHSNESIKENNDNNTDLYWNRAKVTRVDGDNVDVFYIDLGYTEIVNISHVKNIDRELFEYIPPQVIHLGIAGIRPLVRSWTSRAITMFERRVQSQEVVVALLDYDETNNFGQVLIYLRCGDSRWRSLTHEMLEEELGLPIEPKSEEYLTEEVVLAALKRAEQELESHLPSNENIKDGDDTSAEAEDPKQDMYVSEVRQTLLPETSTNLHISQLDHGLPAQDVCTSQDITNSDVGVSGFALSSLKPTQFLSLSKMQADKTEEQRQHIRTKLEQELEDCEDDEDQNVPEFEWAKTDLQIGEAAVFADFNNQIRHEIYKYDHPGLAQDDLDELFHESKRTHKKVPSPVSSGTQEQEIIQSSSKVCWKPLTEEEDYQLQKKIEEIMLGRDRGEPELVCALINSIIEPDIIVPCDRLTAVFMAILETLIRYKNLDPLIGFNVLETYLDTAAFDEAMETVLKSLRSSFVKVSQSPRFLGYHHVFVEVLAALFIRADSWPERTCSLIQKFVIASLENWTVFNKQRLQDQESYVTVELIYLECVETFLDIAWYQLNQKFPERCATLQEEIKEKLLHDNSHRNIRSQLLKMLLKLHSKVTLSVRMKTSRRDVAVQTEDQRGDQTGLLKSLDTSTQQTTSDIAMGTNNYRLPTSRSGPVAQLVDSGSGEESDTDLSSQDDLNAHNKNGMLETCDYVNQADESILKSSTAPSSQRSPNVDHEAQTDDPRQQLPSVYKHVPDQQRKYPHDNCLFAVCPTAADVGPTVVDVDVSKVKQRHTGLNVYAPEFKFNSSWNFTKQVKKHRCQPDVQKCELLTDLGPRFSGSSQDCDTETLKPGQTKQGLGVDNDIAASREKTYREESNCIGTCANGCFDQQKDFSNIKNEPHTSIQSNANPNVSQTENYLKSLENVVPKGNDKKNKIKYTPQELKALNIDNSAHFELVKTTKQLPEVNLEDQTRENMLNVGKLGAAEPKVCPSSTPTHRYTESEDSPLEISFGPRSNSAKWKSLSELLPFSPLRHGQTNPGTSVDPEHLSCEVSNTEPCASKKTQSRFLRDIAEGVISSVHKHPSEKDNFISSQCEELSTVQHKREIVNSGDNNSAKIRNMKGNNRTDAPERPVTYFKSEELLQEKVTTSDCDGVLHAQTSTTAVGHKGKKKKIKFRPITEVLTEKSSIHDVHGASRAGHDLEESSHLEDLQVEVGGQIIHKPKPGALTISSNKRSLLQTSEHKQDKPRSCPWVPGKPVCTWCGSEDHTVYNCPEGDPLMKANDLSCFL